MKRIKLERPDKMLLSGLKTLESIVALDLYSNEKSKAKGNIHKVSTVKPINESTGLYFLTRP